MGTKPGLLSVRAAAAANPGKKRSKSESKSRSRYAVAVYTWNRFRPPQLILADCNRKQSILGMGFESFNKSDLISPR